MKVAYLDHAIQSDLSGSRVALVDSEFRANGVRLHYVQSGTPSDEAILFLHGLNGDLHGWDHELAQLGAVFYCVAFDMPGHGSSDAISGPLNADVVAESASALLDELGIKRCVVVGRSMGGLTAVHLCEHDKRFVGLVLVSGTLLSALEAFRRPYRSIIVNPGVLAATGLQVLAAITPGAERLFAAQAIKHRSILSNFSARPKELSESAIRYALTSHATPRTTIKAVRNAFFYDYVPHMKSLDCPVLVVSGDKDHLIGSADIAKFADLVPQAEILMVRGAGHWLASDAPDAVTCAVQKVAAAWLGHGTM